MKPVQEFMNYRNFTRIDHRDPELIATAVGMELDKSDSTRPAISQAISEKMGIEACMKAWADVAGPKVTTED